MTEDKEILEPEVLPPDRRSSAGPGPGPGVGKRAQRAFGPILAGAFLDFMDLATIGPVGLLLGAAAGYWIASIFELPRFQRFLVAIAAGYYCMMPATRLIPLATLIGAYVRFRDTGRPKR